MSRDPSFLRWRSVSRNGSLPSTSFSVDRYLNFILDTVWYMEVAYVDVKNGGLAVRQITSLNRYLDSGLDYGLDCGLLYLLHLTCSLSLFRLRQWPTFFCHGLGLHPFLTLVSSTIWIMFFFVFVFVKQKRGGTLAIFMKYWINFGNLWAWVFYAIL